MRHGGVTLNKLLGSALNMQFPGLVWKLPYGETWAKYKTYLIFVFLVVVSSLITPNFFSASNLINILVQNSFVGLMAIGMTFVILTAGIDLSVASIFAFCCVLTGLFQHWGIYLGHTDQLSYLFPLPIIFIVVMLIGTAIGFISGVLIAKFGITDFIVTLGMLVSIRGLAYTVSGGQTVFGVDPWNRYLGIGKIGPVPVPVLIWGLALAGAVVVLRYTVFGKHVFVVGENREAARLSGINIDSIKIKVYAISGFLCAVAGILMTGRVDQGEPRAGEAWELDVIAAVVIGGTSLAGGKGTVFGSFIGVVILGLITNILDLVKIHPYPQIIVKGLVILGALMMQRAEKA
jgi:ribose/xylose/arabinose/galactoside ABC-type transport system permease subunit